MRSSSRAPIESISSNSAALSSSVASIACMARTPSLLNPLPWASVKVVRNGTAWLSPSSAIRTSLVMMSAVTAVQVVAMQARVAPAL
jgi:hypothetical protein